jgi:DNA-binding response OmpR family regulator
MPKKKILIIDDEVDFCLLLQAFYSRKGFEVFLSHTLKEGLDCIRSIEPDIIFLDNNLPDGLGWKVAAYIQDNYPATRLTLISAYNSELAELQDTSNVQVLEKPLNLETLDTYYN